MKIILPLFLLALSSTTFASITCTSSEKNGGPYSEWFETKTFSVEELSSKAITISYGKDQNKFDGSFDKIAKNKLFVYSCNDLTDLADQSDIGNMLVSPQLLKGQNGTITLSVKQLGDSEGYSWINETFDCVVK